VAPITRRRFLGSILAAAAVGGAGLVARLATSQEQQPSAVVTTSSPTAAPPPPQPTTSTSTTVGTTTTEATTTTTVAATTTAPGTQGLQVICGEAWGALPISGEFIAHAIEHITIHHTAVVLDDNAAAPGRVRQHQSFHQSLGWPDLAYHFIIDAKGNIYEGRPTDAVGDTGTDYDPTGHLLICCEGHFDQQEITPRQYESLVKMVAWGSAEFGVDPGAILGHRDVASTTCPGDSLYAALEDGTLHADVAELAGDTVIEFEVVCGPDAVDTVAAIEAGEM